MSHLPTSVLFLQHPLARNSTGCYLLHKSHLLFFVLNLDFTSSTCCSSILAAEEISKSILIHPAHADHYPKDCYHFLPAVPSPGWAPAYSPDPHPAAIPYLWLFSLPQFEAFPSLLYLLGWMTRKNHRELKMWDNHWFIQYHNYALVCLLFPS